MLLKNSAVPRAEYLELPPVYNRICGESLERNYDIMKHNYVLIFDLKNALQQGFENR